MVIFNLYARVPDTLPQELVETLLETRAFQLERIVSAGHRTAAGEWYDQDRNEWVILISGRAGLLFEGEPEPRVLGPGDYVLIPAHRRHRVEWTDPAEKTFWLALHYERGNAG